MKSLSSRFKAAAEFDVGWARRDLKRALLEADEDDELSAEQVHHLVFLNIKCAEWENARLKPLLDLAARAIETLEFVLDKTNHDYSELDLKIGPVLSDFFDALSKRLDEGEGVTALDCIHEEPQGYLQWHAWAAEQVRRGRKQVRCVSCGLWKFVPLKRDKP